MWFTPQKTATNGAMSFWGTSERSRYSPPLLAKERPSSSTKLEKRLTFVDISSTFSGCFLTNQKQLALALSRTSLMLPRHGHHRSHISGCIWLVCILQRPSSGGSLHPLERPHEGINLPVLAEVLQSLDSSETRSGVSVPRKIRSFHLFRGNFISEAGCYDVNRESQSKSKLQQAAEIP